MCICMCMCIYVHKYIYIYILPLTLYKPSVFSLFIYNLFHLLYCYRKTFGLLYSVHRFLESRIYVICLVI